MQRGKPMQRGKRTRQIYSKNMGEEEKGEKGGTTV